MNPQLSTWQSMVREFHQAMALPCGDLENPTDLTGEMRKLRVRLIAEEMAELGDAVSAYDTVETCDAIADLAYVVLGTFDCVGKVARPRFELLIATTNCRGWSNFNMPFIREVQALLGLTSIALNQMIVDEPFDKVYVLNEVMVQLGHVCSATGIDLRPIFGEVHRSNMTKAPPTYRADGKLMKGPNFTPPDIAGELRKQGVAL